MIERRSPLPVARYWVTAFGDKEPALAAWLNTQVLAGFVKVTVTERISETADHPAGTFFVFVVTKPNTVPWFGNVFGFPNLAGADIKSLADTVDRPDLPQDGLDELGELAGKVASSIGSGFGLLGVGLGAVLLITLLASRKR